VKIQPSTPQDEILSLAGASDVLHLSGGDFGIYFLKVSNL